MDVKYAYDNWYMIRDIPFWVTYRALQWILYIEQPIMRHDGYYYRGMCNGHDGCMYIYDPHGSQTKRQLDMQHNTWHCIFFYHWWYWYCVLLILVVVFCENSNWWILSCYQEYVIASVLLLDCVLRKLWTIRLV